jgi:hypothetical protein
MLHSGRIRFPFPVTRFTIFIFLCALVYFGLTPEWSSLRRRNRSVVASPEVLIGLTFSRHHRALHDAVQCMNRGRDGSTYFHSLEERWANFRAIHDKIASIINQYRWCSHGFTQYCWADYCGPWIEDLWCSQMNRSFSDFGPFIPLFVPWIRAWGHPHCHSRCYLLFLSSIFELLDRRYLYVTVSHNDDGVEGRDDRMVIPENLFVLSAGGKGHVPLVLFRKSYNFSSLSIPSRYQYDAVFLGTIESHWVRRFIGPALLRTLGTRAYVGSSPQWIDFYAQSKFILCPRGFGRNSFRLTEVLQMGMVPVYVYDDMIWLPYYDSIGGSKFSFVARWDQLNTTLQAMRGISAEQVREMRLRVRELYNTHFSVDGLFKQLFGLLQGGFGSTDLRCANYSSVRSLFPAHR